MTARLAPCDAVRRHRLLQDLTTLGLDLPAVAKAGWPAPIEARRVAVWLSNVGIDDADAELAVKRAIALRKLGRSARSR